MGSLTQEAQGARLEKDSPEKLLRELAEAMEVLVVNTTQARSQFSDLITRVGFTGQRVVLERNGKLLAALVPLEVLAAVIAAEDRLDVAAARKALKEPGRRPWSEVRKELGLDKPKAKTKTKKKKKPRRAAREPKAKTKKKPHHRRRAVA